MNRTQLPDDQTVYWLLLTDQMRNVEPGKIGVSRKTIAKARRAKIIYKKMIAMFLKQYYYLHRMLKIKLSVNFWIIEN